MIFQNRNTLFHVNLCLTRQRDDAPKVLISVTHCVDCGSEQTLLNSRILLTPINRAKNWRTRHSRPFLYVSPITRRSWQRLGAYSPDREWPHWPPSHLPGGPTSDLGECALPVSPMKSQNSSTFQPQTDPIAELFIALTNHLDCFKLKPFANCGCQATGPPLAKINIFLMAEQTLDSESRWFDTNVPGIHALERFF